MLDYDYPYDYTDYDNEEVFTLQSAQVVQVDPTLITPEPEVAGNAEAELAAPVIDKGFAARFQAQSPMGPDVNG